MTGTEIFTFWSLTITAVVIIPLGFIKLAEYFQL